MVRIKACQTPTCLFHLFSLLTTSHGMTHGGSSLDMLRIRYCFTHARHIATFGLTRSGRCHPIVQPQSFGGIAQSSRAQPSRASALAPACPMAIDIVTAQRERTRTSHPERPTHP